MLLVTWRVLGKVTRVFHSKNPDPSNVAVLRTQKHPCVIQVQTHPFIGGSNRGFLGQIFFWGGGSFWCKRLGLSIWMCRLEAKLWDDIEELPMGVSKNNGKTPQIIHLEIYRVFHEINHPFWGTPIFGNTHIYVHICPYSQNARLFVFCHILNVPFRFHFCWNYLQIKRHKLEFSRTNSPNFGDHWMQIKSAQCPKV